MKKRVVITGMGLVTPLGIGVQESWKALCEGKSGAGTITRFDASGFDTRIAAEVKNFSAEDFLPKKEAKRTQLHIAYAVAAAKMALKDADLELEGELCDRTGVYIGCGLGGLDILEKTSMVIATKGPKRVTPFFIPLMIGNMAAGMVSIHLGARGPNSSVATACAAGSHGIGDSVNIIRRGDADLMIAGGVESVITPCCIAGFNAMKALSTRNDSPRQASRPFDRDRDGFVVGEGSGILILESLDHALKRGARIHAEVLGYGMSGDGYHMTAPPPDGDGMARCMAAALKDAGLGPGEIDYINAHGTSTQLNDLYETRAIKKVFGKDAYGIPISSTKSMTGHLLGGAGGVEAVFTTLAVVNDIVPPTINLENPGEECDLDYVPGKARRLTVRAAMSNSFGFGGTNAALVIGKYEE